MENLVNNHFSEVYAGKRVLVTGHTGFKGSWLCEWLLMLNAQVKGFALEPDTVPNHFDILKLENRMESVFSDIRNSEVVKKEINTFQPDFIFHLAAQPLVRRSFRIPAETFDVNVTGTANLLEAVKELGKPCVVMLITTDKVYENREQDILYKESDKLGGFDPYSSSKACMELVIQSFRRSFFNLNDYPSHHKLLAAARAGNVIGGGDFSEDRLMPDIVRALFNNDPLLLRHPKSIRPWQHVLEPLSGYLLWGAKLYGGGREYSGAINFGPLQDDHLTVEQVVNKAIQIFGKGSWQKDESGGQVHEAGILKLDINKAKELLSWTPRWDAQTAIHETLQWYMQPIQNKGDYTRLQIEKYMCA
ncbi:MAG: CDP-glucose 4,6-dehydratase [Ferruginibacter sp.]|nr:CDP-glucose 4,6-dehydratase [Ferruginibacter sp.]